VKPGDTLVASIEGVGTLNVTIVPAA
jgi:2-keto-4-pentenoate hydratase/2-oxohepta-3-ene-1,7-dioic acid hydratase in catechol pathway